MIGEICRDLERRCDEAERPYRDEQAKRLELRRQLEAVETEKGALERIAQQQRAELDVGEQERKMRTVELEEARKELKTLARDLQENQQETGRVISDAKIAEQLASCKSREQDLAYLATLTGKDDLIDEHSAKLDSAESHIDKLKFQLEEAAQDKSRLNESISVQKADIQGLNEDLAKAKAEISSKVAQIDRFRKSEADLMCTRDELFKDLQKMSERYDLVVKEHEAKMRTIEAKTTQMAKEHETHVIAKDAEISSLEDAHKASCQQWQAEMTDVNCKAAVAKEQNNVQIAAMRKKIAKLRDEREKESKELADIKEASSNLMKFMGTRNRSIAPTDAKAKRSDCRGETSLSPSRSAAKRRAPDCQPPASTASSSSSRGHPTAKRIQTHRLSPIKEKQAGTRTKPLSSPAKSVSWSVDDVIQSPRTPLSELKPSQNLANVTPTQCVIWENGHPPANEESIEMEGNVPHEWHSDEESFSSENIFTSTVQQQLPGLRGTERPPLANNTPDESTTEF